MTNLPHSSTARPRYITADTAAQIWQDVRASVPLGTDRLKHGTLAICGWWTGSFTQTQLDEFNRRIEAAKRAAKKAAKVSA